MKSGVKTRIELLDSTLRDGTQGAKISFSIEDKIMIAKKLDELGIKYIEGGFPFSNNKDAEFFKRMQNEKLEQAKLVAFGSTRKPGGNAETDLHITALVATGTPTIVVVGKGWTVHVTDVLKTTLEENLDMISDSIRYLKKLGKEVIFDCEHFFDGFKDDPDYALKVLQTAEKAGADRIVLCDTNGGLTTTEALSIVRTVKERIAAPLGIHVHNDSGMAVATSVSVVDEGITHIQGTINGYGERCGNADLCSIIPNLKLKMGIDCISDEQLGLLTHVSRFVAELANYPQNDKAPYVGNDAFAHKAGQHVDVLQKNKKIMEHTTPELVGNERRILISELAGKSSVLEKLKVYKPGLDKNSEEVALVTEKLKEMEADGYEYEAAEASFDLLMKRTLNIIEPLFKLKDYQVSMVNSEDYGGCIIAGVRVIIGPKSYRGSSFGNGPVDAINGALRDALSLAYPSLETIRLIDFKVRVVNGAATTAAKVRVFIRSTDGKEFWDTVGVSENIIEASWQALVDSLEYKLAKPKQV